MDHSYGQKESRGREPVKKSSDFRRHAKECRALARKAPPGEYRDQLLALAEAWDLLAIESEAALKREPERI